MTAQRERSDVNVVDARATAGALVHAVRQEFFVISCRMRSKGERTGTKDR
jgi:hypothetical protein